MIDVWPVSDALVAALAAGDDARALAVLADLAGLERRVRRSVDALLTDLAFVLRLAPRPIAATAEVMLPSGARFGREALALLETFCDAQRPTLLREPAQFFPLVHEWFRWLDAPSLQLDRWVDAECAARALGGGSGTAPQLWLRRLPPAPMSAAPPPSFGVEGEPRALSEDGALLLAYRILPLYERTQGWTLGGEPMPPPPLLAAYRGAEVAVYSFDATTPIAPPTTHRSPVRHLRFADRNRVVVSATENEVHASRSSDGAALGSASNVALTQLLPMDHGHVLLHHPDGTRLFNFIDARATPLTGPPPETVTYTRDGKPEEYRLYRKVTAELRLIDTASGRVLLGIVLGGRLQSENPSGVLSPDGRRLLVRNRGRAQLWSTETLAPLAVLPPFGDSINTSIKKAYFSADSQQVYVANATTRFGFAAVDGTPFGEPQPVGADDGAAGDPPLASARMRADIAEGSRTRLTAPAAGATPALVVSPTPEPRLSGGKVRFVGDGKHLLCEHPSGLRLWSLTTGLPVQHWPDERVRLAFAGDSWLLVTCRDELLARDLSDGGVLWRVPLPKATSEKFTYLDQPGCLLGEGPAGIVALDAMSGATAYTIVGARLVLARSTHLVATTASGTMLVLDARDGRTVATLPKGGAIFDVSRDGEWLVRAGAGYDTVEVWHLPDVVCVSTFSYDGGSPRLLHDPLRLYTFESISPQSGNTDTDIEREYALPSGALVATRSEDVYGYGGVRSPETAVARTLADGVAVDNGWLTVDGSRLLLDDDDHLAAGADRRIYVARESKPLFSLFAVERSRPIA